VSDAGDRLQHLEHDLLDAASRAPVAVDGSRIATLARAEAAAALYEDDGGELASRRFVATALAELAVARALDRRAAAELLEDLDEPERLAVALAALAHPTVAALALPEALLAISSLLTALGSIAALSAWRADLAGRMICVHEHGDTGRAEAIQALAKRCLTERGAITGPDGLNATPVRAFGGISAAVVWRAEDEDQEPRSRLLAQQAAAALAAPLQHALTADDNFDAHRALVQAPERRLTRLALDLHDGALQDAALIAGELRRLEDDLRPALKGRSEGERVRGTLETLASLVEALDTDLREVATNIEGPSMLKRPFAEVIASAVSAFRSRARVDAELDVSGDFEMMTDSQRITVFRVVQESLANVRQHASAKQVTVRVAGKVTHVEAEVVDDGVGFDLETVVDTAGRSGRLGIVGMVERVRLLGGRCDITSRPGRGTSVKIWIARYEPRPG
jgi:signal transduction histidine kinase